MLTDEAIERLRQRLRVSGSTLKDCPVDWEGLRWHEYMEVHWADMRAEAQRAREGQPGPMPVEKLATARLSESLNLWEESDADEV